MLPRLIGLCGYAETGKDEVGHVFQRAGYVRVGIADAIKREYCKANNLELSDLADRAVKELHRQGIEDYGAERRAFDPWYWIREARHLWIARLRAGESVVITDCRHLSEIQAILRDRGNWIMVARKGKGPATRREQESFGVIGDALTRGTLRPPVKQFDNDGSLAALHARVAAWIVEQRGKACSK